MKRCDAPRLINYVTSSNSEADGQSTQSTCTIEGEGEERERERERKGSIGWLYIWKCVHRPWKYESVWYDEYYKYMDWTCKVPLAFPFLTNTKSRKGKKKEERAEESRGSLTEREILQYKWRGWEKTEQINTILSSTFSGHHQGKREYLYVSILISQFFLSSFLLLGWPRRSTALTPKYLHKCLITIQRRWPSMGEKCIFWYIKLFYFFSWYFRILIFGGNIQMWKSTRHLNLSCRSLIGWGLTRCDLISLFREISPARVHTQSRER